MNQPTPGWRRLMLAMLLTLVLVTPAVFHLVNVRTTSSHESDADFHAAANWIASTTPSNSHFLFPPVPIFMPYAKRDHVIDQLQLGFSLYYRNLARLEVEALRDVYGVDPVMLTLPLPVGTYRQERNYLCRLHSGYSDLLSNPARLGTVVDDYAIDYVVGPLDPPAECPGAWVPSDNWCEVFDFANSSYGICRTSNLRALGPGSGMAHGMRQSSPRSRAVIYRG